MKSYWFVFCRDELLLRRQPDGRLAVPLGEEAPVCLAPEQTVQPLPDLGGVPCRAVGLDAPVVAEGCVMLGLRASFDVLELPIYRMAGKARELLYWDASTRFCGVCGAPLRRSSAISKRCPACGREVWPPLATAIIVLVRRGDEVLLVQSNKFRGDYFGLVAGFVETGETLEECVAREVREETQIDVAGIRYFGSQPWPYPSGLMVGFYADYAGGELRLQRSELNKGGWFRRDALPAIPGKLSMARMLLDAWLEDRLELGRPQ